VGREGRESSRRPSHHTEVLHGDVKVDGGFGVEPAARSPSTSPVLI
jgi:hypothetical protein